MPKRFRSFVSKKAPKRRRTFKAAASAPRKRSTVTRNRNLSILGKGFPKKMMMTHKYVETITMSLTATSLATYYISTNSLYDPNETSTGHQPLYFDQMTALYDHYTVIGSKIKIRFIPNPSNSIPVQVAVMLNDNNTLVGPSNIDGIAEQSMAKTRVIGPLQQFPATLGLKWSAKKTFGASVMANNSLQGASGAAPSEQTYFMLAAQNVSTGTQSLSVQVEVEYIAVWKELKEVSPS